MQSPPKFPRKQVILLSIAFFTCLLLILFNSCKKNDFSQTPWHNANFNEQFFKTTSANKDVARIINLLKTENNRTNFVNKLPANCGLPIWDKLLIQKNIASRITEDSTGTIVIPLTNNNQNLSSIIIAKQSNNGFIINCYTTNGYLYQLCNTATADMSNAESKMGLFMFMENRAWGTTKFYHIPVTMFTTRHTQAMEDGKKMIEIATLPDTTVTAGLMGMACWLEPSGVCNCVDPAHCDWRSGCAYCSAVYCEDPGGGSGGGSGGGPGGENPDDDPPSGGDGGGSGGSGGGTGGGGNPDCPFQGAWYSLIPLPPGDCDPTYNPHNATRIEVDSSIYNNFPCLDTLLQNLPNANQVTQELLHNTFGVNIYSNLTFQIDWTLDSTSSTNAYTTPGGGYSYTGIFRFFDTIKLNPWVVRNSSKEYLIGNIMHEAAHAYIRYRLKQWELGYINTATFIDEFPLFWPHFTNPLNATELMEHQQMAFSYVAQISTIVEQYFNPLASNVLKTRVSNSIAWEGLRESTMWKLPGLDTCRITRENIAARNTNIIFHIPAYGTCSSATVRYDSLGLSLPCH